MAKDKKELDARKGRNGPAARSIAESLPEVPFEEGELDEEDGQAFEKGLSERDGSNGEMESEPEEYTVPISELRKVRSEAARYRKRLRDLENRIKREQKEAQLAKMEETDRLKAIAEEAEAKAKAFKKKAEAVAKRAAVINAASALDFHNPKDAASIIDIEQIEAEDDGTVDEERVNELVRSLAESKPYLIKEQDGSLFPAGFGPTNPPSSNWPKPKSRAKDRIDGLKEQANAAIRSGRVAEAVKLYNQAWEMERGIRRTKGG